MSFLYRKIVYSKDLHLQIVLVSKFSVVPEGEASLFEEKTGFQVAARIFKNVPECIAVYEI